MPVRKPGKKASEVQSYRPINIISCIGKVYERCLLYKLHPELELALGYTQHSYLKNRSADIAILKIINYITDSICEGEYCAAVGLDLSRAFECTIRTRTVRRMADKMGLSG